MDSVREGFSITDLEDDFGGIDDDILGSDDDSDF